MVYIRSKKIGNKIYFFIARGDKVEGKVRQKVFYIGDKEALSKLYENIKKKLE